MIESGLLRVGNFFIDLEIAALIAILLVAAGFDIKSRRIPNWLIASSLASSLFYHSFSSYGYGFIFYISGLSVGFLSFLPLYIFRAMGAGDVKLVAVVGSYLGGLAAFQTVVLTLLAGGVLALLVMFWNRSWKLVYENIGLMTANITIAAMTKQLPKAKLPPKSAGNLPYGVAIAVGTFLYIFFFRH